MVEKSLNYQMAGVSPDYRMILGSCVFVSVETAITPGIVMRPLQQKPRWVPEQWAIAQRSAIMTCCFPKKSFWTIVAMGIVLSS